MHTFDLVDFFYEWGSPEASLQDRHPILAYFKKVSLSGESVAAVKCGAGRVVQTKSVDGHSWHHVVCSGSMP